MTQRLLVVVLAACTVLSGLPSVMAAEPAARSNDGSDPTKTQVTGTRSPPSNAMETISLVDIQRHFTAEQQAHIAWVEGVLRHMLTIKPGMTRKQLLEVFTTEGGLSNRLHRTYVSIECPDFKVDVEFEAVGPSAPDRNMGESDQDRITKISTPYLAFWYAG